MPPYPSIIRLARRRRPPAPPWLRALRTVGLGCALGLLGAVLGLLSIALVRGRPLASLEPGTPDRIVEAARAVLPAPNDAPTWRSVARFAAPWGEVVRLRPYVEGVEIRGADCILSLGGRTPGEAASVPSARFERDPASIDWSEPRRELAPALQRKSALARPSFLLLTADVSLAAPPRLFLELRRRESGATAWALHQELTVTGPASAVGAALRELPWTNDRPAADEAVDLRLTLDPATLEITEVSDARCFATGRGTIFDPNPVVTSGRLDLRNGAPVDEWRRTVPLERLDGTGLLSGSLVTIKTDRPPRAEEASLLFDYRSADPRFEEVMAYAHGDRSVARAESLGFSGLFAEPLVLRVHASAADNSWYSQPTREVFFGDGGVDDAEDADIILHECGHALHDALVPGFGGGDTRALSEGFSDFWAASLTDGACVGDWDATSYSPPCLRRVDESAVYPWWLTGLPHHDGMLWSALLWDLRARLGAREAERLALAALAETGTGTTWPEAASGLTRAAERIGLAARLPEIREVVARRGFGPILIEASLGANEARRIDLLTPARFLGHEVTALLLQGDGRLLFLHAGDGFEARPFPAGPPTFVPCGRAQEKGTLRLVLRCEIGGDEARIEQRWFDGALELARIGVVWNIAAGSLTWRYEYLRSDQMDGFFAGATDGGTDGAAEVTPLQLGALAGDGLGGLNAFRSELGPTESGASAGAELLGAGFVLTPEAAGFRLRERNKPVSAGAGAAGLLVLPNPVRGQAEIRLLLPVAAQTDLALFDLLGRRVRSWGSAERPVGLTPIPWDARDGAGRRLPAGLYWMRAVVGGRTLSVRVVLLD